MLDATFARPDLTTFCRLDDLGLEVVGQQLHPDRAVLSSNSVSVQMQAIRAGAGVGIVHDFAIPFAPGVELVLPERIALKRSFWLIRHADDRASRRLSLLADLLAQGLRAEVARLESLLSA